LLRIPGYSDNSLKQETTNPIMIWAPIWHGNN
jgi:hypothetical protein